MKSPSARSDFRGNMKTKSVLLILFGASSYAQTGTFTPTGGMTVPRATHTATLLPNGKVLIAGGTTNYLRAATGSPSPVELYDPSTGTFTASGAMTASNYVASATLLPDGRVLLIESRNAELYDPSTGTVTATGSMIDGQGGPATLLSNGKVLMTGSGDPQLYDPSTGAFTLTGPYASVYNHDDYFKPTVTLLPNGEVLFAEDVQYVRNNSAELYDSTTNTFRLTGTMVSFLLGRTTTLLVNGKVLRAGGREDLGGFPNAEEQYDPATGMFTATGGITTPRSDHTAVLLPDGAVLITGGFHYPMGPIVFLASAELYDSSTGTFTAAGNMTARRAYHTATVLNDGRVLITGGVSPLGMRSFNVDWIQSSAEIYTPPVLVPAPALFSLSGDGRGQGSIWHAQTGQIASAGNLAVAGEALSMYTTTLADGGVIPPQIAIGGRLAEVLYFGASGYPGYTQVNFRVPSGIVPGTAVPVRLSYLGRSTNEVTIGVQ